MKKLLGIIVLGLLLSGNVSADEELSINSLLKDGYKITKDEIIKRNDVSWGTKVVTLRKKNEYVVCTLIIDPGSNYQKLANCMKP